MKKQKQTEKKLSLRKLQITQLNTIRAGDGDNDTVLDNTYTKSGPRCKDKIDDIDN